MTLTILRGAAAPPERVILVDRNDSAIGSAEKLAAHRDGVLHRACSVFVFNDAGALLLQRRAAVKYHSPGLWSNSCCGHPRPGEQTVGAARRRLREEMGVDCVLEAGAAILYRAALGDGLTEHEYDHIFFGRSSGVPAPDPAEADAYAWRDLATLLPEMRDCPERFTAWFAPALRALIESGHVNSLIDAQHRAAVHRIAADLVSPSANVITVMAGLASPSTREHLMSTADQIPTDLLQRVTSLAAQDRSFRRLLLEDPIAAVEATFGVTLPPNFRVKFMERPPEVDAVIVLDALPAAPSPDGSLSEADLDAVAGGHGPVARRSSNTAKW